MVRLPALSTLAACLVFQLPQAPPVVETKTDVKFLAGSYVQGDGFVNTSLRIDPDGHFSYHWHADDGGSHRENGEVEIIDGFLILHTEKVESNRKPDALTHPRYRPVRWGDRRYLISDEQMVTFCNMVNLGLEPRRGRLGKEFMRITATEKSRMGEEEPVLGEIQGQPGVPAEWVKYLLKRPVEGKILEGLDDRCARIDLGSNDGLVKGMELFVVGGKPEAQAGVAIVVVVEVKEKDCRVKAKLRPRGIDRFEKGQSVYSKIPAGRLQEVRASFSVFW